MTTDSWQERLEHLESLNNKMILYEILYKHRKPGENVDRYDLTEGFMDHVNIMLYEVSHNPELAKVYEKQLDYGFVVSLVARYLAMARVRERKTAGLPEYKKNVDSQVITGEEISKEVDALLDRLTDEEFVEISYMAKAVYHLLKEKINQGNER